MINARMFALAAAMLLGLAVFATSQQPDEDVIETAADVAAWVQDLELVSPPDRYEYPPWELGEEQLVEGHIVFHTIERTPQRIEENGSIDIVGNVNCQHHVNATTQSWFGLVFLPDRVTEAWVECHAGERIVVTPSIFRASTASPMMPTGNGFMLDTPTGEPAYAQELVFSVTELQSDGTFVAKEYYAWNVPVIQSWVYPDGTTKNLWFELPLDKLREMGTDRFEVIPERSL